MTVVALIIAVPACDVHSCTISFDLWAPRYRKVDESAMACNLYDPEFYVGWDVKRYCSYIVHDESLSLL